MPLFKSANPRRSLLEIAIEPRSRADQPRLASALARLATEDSSCTYRIEQPSGRTMLGGDGEIELDRWLDHLRRSAEIELEIGRPEVVFLEVLKHKVEIDASLRVHSWRRSEILDR